MAGKLSSYGDSSRRISSQASTRGKNYF